MKKSAAVKQVTKKATPAKRVAKKPAPTRAAKGRKPVRKSFALPRAIIETSPITWSHDSIGPTFEEIQLAAYHRWLQLGGSDLDNWTGAENDLRSGQ